MGANYSRQYYTDDGIVAPFLKWAGGKRWLSYRAADVFPSEFGTYYEPFFGSGAVFFSLRPRKAVISDANKRLMEMYASIKYNWRKVFDLLSEHHEKHSKEYYYLVRETNYRDSISRAAQLIYLNRTCWNGLYRVNAQGKFNVPKGTRDYVLTDDDNFPGASKLLRNAYLRSGDFEDAVFDAKRGDLVFFDPPYTVKHNNNGFIKYNEGLFSWDDQVRLRDCAVRLAKKGVRVVVSNADHESIKDLYDGIAELICAERPSVISGLSVGRARTTELIIRLGKGWID